MEFFIKKMRFFLFYCQMNFFFDGTITPKLEHHHLQVSVKLVKHHFFSEREEKKRMEFF